MVILVSLVAQLVKNPPAMWENWVRSLGWEDPLEKGIGYPLQYSSLENSMDCIVHGGLKEWDTTERCSLHFTSLSGEEKGYPLQYSGLEDSMDYTIHGVAKSWT